MAASSDAPSRSYKLVSATYQDKKYPDGFLLVDASKRDLELRQWTGKKKKDETVIARFHLEPNAEARVDGPLLVVSELAITLESPAVAEEIAGLLASPAKDPQWAKGLAEAEAAVDAFLELREEATSLLARMKVDPRGAMLSAESMWTSDDTEPLDSIYSAYSARLSESLTKAKSSLAGAEGQLGPLVIERLYALAYTIGVVQNALLDQDSSLAKELAALQELGVSTTAQDLLLERPTARIMLRAHEVLEGLPAARPAP